MNTPRLAAMCLRLSLAASLFLGATTVLAAPSGVSQEDLAAQKELVQAKMDALKDLQQKDMDAAKSRMDAIDKRLDDQISKMGQGVDRFGIWITVLLAGLGTLGYFSVVRRTKAEAEDAARQWFDAHAKDLKNQIEQLKDEAQTARATIVESVEGVQEHGQSAKDGITKYVQTLQANVGDQTPHSDPKALQEAQDAVASRAEQLRNTAESSYSFDDWNTRAHAAYAANQLEDAAQHWRKAAEIPNAGSVRVAQALFNRGVTQGQLGQSAEAINTYNEVLHRFGDASDIALKELLARALLNKGFAQRQLGQNVEAINTCNELLYRFGDASEIELKERVARALLNKGVAQGQLGQRAEEINSYDEVLRRFGDASEAALKESVARALFNIGVAQGQLRQSAEAIKTCDELLRRFGEASEIALKEQVARALLNKAVAQGQLGQRAEEINSYDEVLRRFGDSSEVALKELVAYALLYKGIAQKQLERNEEAIKAYDEVLHRFGDASETALKARVAEALNGIGFVYLTQAKAQWSDQEAAKALLQQALASFHQAINKTPLPLGMALGNRAYAHWLLGNSEAAERDFHAGLRAEKFGGQELYEGTLKDFDIHPISEDQGMRQMVERQWLAWKAEQGKGDAAGPSQSSHG